MMAKQMSIIPFTGKLGNLIGYQRNGQYFLRSMPEVVRQTVATRRAARRFGLASRKAALIRNALYNDLDIRCDSGHINRLNKALIAAGSDHAAIRGFRFNQHVGVDRFFTVAPRVSCNGILDIVPQTLVLYKGIIALEIKVIAARIDFITHQVTGTETVTLSVDPNGSFEGINVPLDVPGDGTLVVTLQVRCMQKDVASCNRQYLAADIIAVVEPQTLKPFDKRTYPQQARSQSKMALNLTNQHTCQPIIQRE